MTALADTPIPTYIKLMLPTLQALDKLGGSGTKEEIDEAVVAVADLSQAQMEVEFPEEAVQKGSKVLHRLAWARTYLKKVGAVQNSKRGVWTLEPMAREFLDADPVTAADRLRSLDGQARKAARARVGTSGDVVFDGSNAEEGTLDSQEPPSSGEATDDGDVEIMGWAQRLLARLMALSPDAFERLAQRLLREAGFRNVEVTGRSGDRGIDGIGVYRPSLVSFPIYFQCKRYAGSVGSGEVRDFRGAMTGRGEKWLLITSGTFTAEARREATRDGAPPVDLIDGEELCELLKEFGVGVKTEMIEQVEVIDAFFDGL